MCIMNLFNPVLDYDEAGQFFISQGLNHFSPPFAKPSNLEAIIYNNAHYNMDPGGFTLLLSLWTKISYHFVWLRLLPFLFFSLATVVLIRLVWEFTNDLLYAVICGLLMFTITSCPYASFLRPYSMEIMFMLTGLLFINHLQNSISYKSLLVFGIINGLGMTVKYSTILFVFVYSCQVLAFILRTYKPKSYKFIALSLYSTPIIISSLLILTLSYQSQSEGASGQVETFLDNPSLILKPINIIVWLGMLLLLYANRKRGHSVTIISIVVCCLHIVFVIMSICGKFPYNLFSRYGGSLLLCFFIVLCISSYAYLRRFRYGYAIILLGIITTIGVTSIKSPGNLANITTIPKYNLCEDINKTEPDTKVFVTTFFCPSVRYLFEFTDKISNKQKYINYNFAPGYAHVGLKNTKYGEFDFEESMRRQTAIENQLDAGSTIIEYPQNSNDSFFSVPGTNYLMKKK